MPPGACLNPSRPTVLYRLFGADDELLYIGIAFIPSRRWTQHRRQSHWWPEVKRKELTWHDTRREAENAERQAILGENPRYNVARIEGLLGEPGAVEAARTLKGAAPADLVDRLRAAARADRRADDRVAKARRDLRETILRAASLGLGPAEITQLIEHRYSEGHVARMVAGKA